MAEILVVHENSRSLLFHAATLIDHADMARAATAIHMAKAQCGESFMHAADRSIQFHGAIGFTYECHAQLFPRRAQWAEYSFGDARHHRRKLEALLLDGEAFLPSRPPISGLDHG
jgi:alkylation response protein AidB-like acyl-CoA dehydrogenase